MRNFLAKLLTILEGTVDASAPGNPWPLAGGLTTLAVGTILGGLLFIAASMKGVPVTTPTAFKSFQATDQSFKCEYPDGWSSRGGGSNGMASFAVFTKGNARISVETDLAGSLMGDIARSSNQMGGGMGGMEEGGSGGGTGMPNLPGMGGVGQAQAAKKPPIEMLHEAGKKSTEAELLGKGYKEYEEQPLQPFRCQMGEGRLSEFKADGGFFLGKIHGYRLTVLGGERRVVVLSWCPERDWPKLTEAFQRVNASLAP